MKGIQTSRRRALRLMRKHSLLAPGRPRNLTQGSGAEREPSDAARQQAKIDTRAAKEQASGDAAASQTRGHLRGAWPVIVLLGPRRPWRRVSQHQAPLPASQRHGGRFNGRIGSEVLGITVYSHKKLEQLLRGFNAAYNARRQRVLGGKTPEQVVTERLQVRRKLARGEPEGQAGPADIALVRHVVGAAKVVSQPDN